MNKKNNQNDYPDISGVFDIDESTIPDKMIAKDPDTAKITEPILTSDAAQRFLPKDAKKALEKEKKANKKRENKNKRRTRLIIILSAILALFLTVSIINFVIEDSKIPTISAEKPVTETISRYHTDTAVSVKQGAVFIDNDYDVHFIEKGQKVELSSPENMTFTGTVSDIKEEAPDSALITKHYPILTGSLPSTPVYAVYITFDNSDSFTEEGTEISAKVLTKTSENALTVPSSAVFINGNQHFVWIYSPFKKTLSKQDVNIGISSDGRTEITNGIKKSDRIAVTFSCSPEVLHEGIRVKTD
ncbi:MAG: hypothetical protein IKL10_10900 [Clostridia bacterium]|nr:hypothetical protein [Clostridia bacterium]